MIYLAGKSHSQNIQEVNTPNIRQKTINPHSMRQIMNNMCWYDRACHDVNITQPSSIRETPVRVSVKCVRGWSVSSTIVHN